MVDRLRRRLATGAAVSVGLSLCLLAFGASPALATSCTSCTWSGASTASPDWSDSGNWAGTVTPAATGASLDFPALASCAYPSNCYSSDNNSQVTAANSLTIEDDSPYSITGSGFTLGSGGLTGQTTSTSGPVSGPPIIYTPIALGANQNWSVSAPAGGFGEVALMGALSGASYTLTVNLSNGALGLGGMPPFSIDDEVGAVTVSSPVGSTGALTLGPGASLNGTNGNPVSFTDSALSAQGSNAIGALTTVGSNVSIEPFSPTSSSVLAVTGGITMDSTSGLSLGITGTGSPPAAGTDYTQLTATGNISLNGPSLTLNQYVNSGTSCPSLHVGDVYTLVKTTGTLTGTFGNAPNGSTMTLTCYYNGGSSSGPTVRINYTSSSVTATVISATTTSLKANPSSSVTNQSVTLTATVTPSYGTSTPPGTVEFDNNGASISGCSAQPVSSSGTATCTTSFSASSTPENLTAKYAPSSGSAFNPSTSSSLSYAVSKDSTSTALAVSNASPSAGQSVTYTATVTPAHAGAAKPSGTVQFSDNGSAISGCSAQPLTQGSSASTATCTTSYSSAGSHSITATYGGDGNFTGSNSPAQSVTVPSPPAPPPTTTPPPATPPAITATTKPASMVGTTTATLNGVIDTKGAAVTWAFEFGQSTNYNKATPVKAIAAGQSQPVAVSWKLIKLQPNTVYHFRLVAVYQASPSQTPVKSMGSDLTFKTNATGKLLMTVGKLKLTGAFAFVPLKCQSRLPCNGRFSITTKTMVGKRGHRHLGSVLCNTRFFKIKRGKIVRIKVKIYPACLALLKHAGHHRIKAQFTSRPRTGQLGVIKTISLFL